MQCETPVAGWSVEWILVSTFKQLLAAVNLELSDDGNGSKDISMSVELMPVHNFQDLPIFEEFVGWFLSISYPLLHVFSLQ